MKIFEVLMIVLFGISWPMNIIKSLKSKTAKGKSLIFLLLILFGYVFGIVGKFVNNDITYVLVFYFINFFMVLFDVVLYFRNSYLDKVKENEK